MKSNRIVRVAVIDDDDQAAQTIIHALEDGLFQAYRQKPADTIDKLAQLIIDGSDAAVCDHRLRYGGYADISGAELAANLIKRGHPTILVTQYLDQYADVAIRSHRSHLPVVLRRGQADEPEELRSAFALCKYELGRGKPKGRKLFRTLLEVKEISKIGDEIVIDAVVHGWSHKDTVRFPLSLVAHEDQQKVKESSILTALTNISNINKVDLYFEDIKIAPLPDLNDGLR